MRSHHRQTPTAKHTWEAHSTYAASLGVPDRRRYRRTPPGSPTVGDLVRPGDTVSTFYSTGGVVIDVKEHFYAAPNGETLSHFTIVYVPPDRAAKYRDCDRHWINECVAFGERILKLFEANTDEVFVVDRTWIVLRDISLHVARARAGPGGARPGRGTESAGGAGTLFREGHLHEHRHDHIDRRPDCRSPCRASIRRH